MPRRRPRAPRARGAHNLGPFEKPGEPYRMSHIRKWEKYGVGDVDLLWGPYWERFNTVQIPILGETDYFNYALEIAKLAQGSEEEFERIYTRRNKERLGEFLELLEKAEDRAFWKHEEFPCEDAADKICAVCKTGALEDFARLLRGITFGWEADIAHDAQPDAHLSECEEAAQSSDSYAGSDYGYWNRLREESEEWKDPRFREEMAACVQPLGVVFFSSTGATLQPFPGATPKDTAEHTESAPYATADQGPTAQKQPPLLPGSASAAEEDEVERLDMTKRQTQRIPDVHDGEHRGLDPETSATPSISYSAFPIEEMPGREASGRGSGLVSGVHEDRLQQQRGAAALVPDSRGPSPSQKPQNGGVAAMKRVRPDDDSDQEHANAAGENNHRRRKMQRLATPEIEDNSKPTGNKRGCRHRAKEKCSSPPPVQRAQPPPSGATHTRSSRRIATTTLWELDRLGRPRPLSS